MDNNENILQSILNENREQTEVLKNIENINQGMRLMIAILVTFYVVLPIVLFLLMRFTDVKVLEVISGINLPF